MVRIYRDHVLDEVGGRLPEDVVGVIAQYLNRSWREALPTAREQALVHYRQRGVGKLVQLRRSCYVCLDVALNR